LSLPPACVPDNCAIPCKTVVAASGILTMPLLKRDMAMGSILQQLRWGNLLAVAKSLVFVPYLVIAILMTLLVWTVFMSDSGWKPEAPDAGILAITFGTMFALVVGTGVMTLVFYDDRRS
jgi:hypothetical protein